MKIVTEEHLHDLVKKFFVYVNIAEQHEFPLLVRIHLAIKRTNISEIVKNQKEARAMYRAIAKVISEDYSDFVEEQNETNT